MQNAEVRRRNFESPPSGLVPFTFRLSRFSFASGLLPSAFCILHFPMRTTAFFGCVLLADFLAVVFQGRFGPLPMFFGATVFVFPVILAYGALSLPLTGTLALAFFNGLLWDALTVQFLKPTEEFSLDTPAVPEFAMGWSILLFGVLALLVHGLRPLFLRGRWELHCLASGFCASAILLAEYLMITFKRHGLVFSRELWGRILVPGFFAMLLAIPVYWLFRGLAGLLGYTVRVYPTKPRL